MNSISLPAYAKDAGYSMAATSAQSGSYLGSITFTQPNIVVPRWPHGMTAVVEAFDDLHVACRMLKEAWE